MKKRIIQIFSVLIFPLILFCSSSGSSSDDDGFSVEAPITNPYSSESSGANSFTVTGPATYTGESQFAIIRKNGSNVGVSLAQYDALSGKEIMILSFFVKNGATLPTDTSTVDFSDPSGKVTIKYAFNGTTAVTAPTGIGLKTESATGSVSFSVKLNGSAYDITKITVPDVSSGSISIGNPAITDPITVKQIK